MNFLRVVPALAALGLFLGAGAAMAETSTMSPTVTIDDGRLAGKSDGLVDAFLGIPFAQPPVGALRWRAPQPAIPWTRTRDATSYGHDCAQLPFPSDAAPLGASPSEDCLYVNVWRPDGAKPDDKLPVMVWIYGGGFVNGGASPAVYSGGSLARKGMVVVSMNYRLGRFGFFRHPALMADATVEEKSGNFGLLDQIAALKWVHGNVAAFGGDPENVTLVGESAGGRSVHAMLTSPLTRGLVQAAVIMSGGDGKASADTMDVARDTDMTFARNHGIDGTGPAAEKALRALSTDQVIDGLNLVSIFYADKSKPRDFATAITDGLVDTDSVAFYKKGNFPHIPIMIGSTSDDIGGPDGYMIKGASDLASMLSAQGVPVWHYHFDYVAESVRKPDTKGAGHATDIPFFFGTVEQKYGAATTTTDLTASSNMEGYLADFVACHNPNGGDLPDWPKYHDNGPTMVFEPDGSAQLAAE